MPGQPRKHAVRLTPEQRIELERIARSQSSGAAKVRGAKILLLSDENHVDGRRTDGTIAEIVGRSERQVVRVRQAFVREGDDSLARKTRSDAGVPKKLDGDAQAQLATLCCSSPPEGRERWTLQLLCDELGRLEIVESVCIETVRQALKKTNSSRGGRNAFASPKPTGPASSRGWKRSSTSIAASTTRKTC